jgi:hypothetical protein
VADERPAAARGRAQLIEPGRALMLADFGPPKVAAGERLIRLAYRMGVSGGALTAPFRKPPKLRLLAAVANPLPGERAAGMALRSGHFLVHGLKLPIMQVDFSGAARLAPPIERVVHGFHWLADLEVAGQRDQKLRDQMLPVAERILNGWLLANPKAPSRPGKGPGWSVDNAGNRLLNWLVHAPLILAGPDKAQRARSGSDWRNGPLAGPQCQPG